jgi:ribose 5-phosphate isomerase A
VVDESKLSPKLGTHWLLPVEVTEFGLPAQARFLESPAALFASLDARAGIAGHGLFIGIAHGLIVAGVTGVRHLRCGLDPGPNVVTAAQPA